MSRLSVSGKFPAVSKARHEWLDDEIELDFGDVGTLHDVIAPPGYQGQELDPAEEAARNLDWETFLASHPPRRRTAILVLVEGGTMREAGELADSLPFKPCHNHEPDQSTSNR